jgi:RNA polymerase sigma-70 factor (family 1)
MYPYNSHSSDDTALLLRLSEGSREAFDKLYDKYWKKVFNAAFKRLNDAEYARDIAQDVFVQLWIRGTQSTIENLPAYLFVAVRNGVFKHFEKESKYASLSDMVYELESRHDRPDAYMLHAEFLEAFKQLIDALPDQQRTIFKMRFEKDLSSQQIADELQLSVKTVRNHMGKALANLRSAMLVYHVFIMLCYYKR